MKTTAEMIEVMKAYEAGKQIETFDTIQKKWELIDIPSWNWGYCNYRIAEEKKYRPYKDTDEMIDDFCKRSGAKRSTMGEPFIWVKNKMNDGKNLITVFENKYCLHSLSSWTMSELFEKFTYLDGSPCGVLE